MDDPSDPNSLADAIDGDESGVTRSAIGQEDMFEALSQERRRYLLYTLFEDEASSLRELATKLAAWENSVPEADVDEEESERVYASLYHAHVPKLADFEIIEFDRDAETITAGDNAEQVLQVLEITGLSDAIDLENRARGNEND